MSKHGLGTKFDSLAHIAGEIYVTTFLSFLKFSLIFMYSCVNLLL